MKDGVGKERRESKLPKRPWKRNCPSRRGIPSRPRRNSVHPVNTRKAPRWNSIIMRVGLPPHGPRTPLYPSISVAALLVSLWHTSSELQNIPTSPPRAADNCLVLLSRGIRLALSYKMRSMGRNVITGYDMFGTNTLRIPSSNVRLMCS